jgi:hypothetical protein
LDNQPTFLKLSTLQTHGGRTARCLPPNYYLTSYTQLTGNGVAGFPPLDRLHPERMLSQLNLKEQDAIEWWKKSRRDL